MRNEKRPAFGLLLALKGGRDYQKRGMVRRNGLAIVRQTVLAISVSVTRRTRVKCGRKTIQPCSAATQWALRPIER